jgi:uncharacterized protein (TIGR01777 family)
METILITGGTGLVGKELCKQLTAKGYSVILLSRSKNIKTEIPSYYWDYTKGEIDLEAIEKADYIMHLAGENVSTGRWTSNRKKNIIDSRVKTTELLLKKVKEKKKPLKAFITASGTNYYGTVTVDTVFTETDAVANDFLGEVCKYWEAAADNFKNSGIRTIKIRTGVVLSKQGGALEKMTIPIKLGIGSALGSGKQYMPWIHIDDLCAIYIKAIEDTNMQGAYNAVAPQHINNKEFWKAVSRELKKPFWFPAVPAFLITLLFGEMGSIVLKGSRVSCEKMKKAGYTFKFASLESALHDLLKKDVPENLE